jgi:hypothetical protein
VLPTSLLPQGLLHQEECHDHTGSRGRTSLCTHSVTPAPARSSKGKRNELKEKGTVIYARCASPIKCLARSRSWCGGYLPNTTTTVALNVSKYGSTRDRTCRAWAAGALTWLTLIAPGLNPRPWPPFSMESGRPRKRPHRQVQGSGTRAGRRHWCQISGAKSCLSSGIACVPIPRLNFESFTLLLAVL